MENLLLQASKSAVVISGHGNWICGKTLFAQTWLPGGKSNLAKARLVVVAVGFA